MKFSIGLPNKFNLGNQRVPSKVKTLLERVPSDWPSREGAGILAGIVIGVLCRGLINRFLSRTRLRRSLPMENGMSSDEEVDDMSGAPASGEHKLVLCVRSDLKMQKGKIAAQVGHATLGAYKKARQKDAAALRGWEHNAQPKIALQIRSHAEAKQLDASARRYGLVTYMVYDAGRTQVASVCLSRVLYEISTLRCNDERRCSFRSRSGSIFHAHPPFCAHSTP
jgi:peptidyl-tRNA hydrolase, PTH2 family